MTPLPETMRGLLAGLRDGDRRSLARAISLVENETPGFQALLHTVLDGRKDVAARAGITGPPGAGKSTLLAALGEVWAARGERVGVLAVDPSSPRTGGAVLGDRIRMGGISDAGVFVRSMASRGADGGLATATLDVLDLMDGFGFDHLLLETIGAGQGETMVASACESVVLVLVPEAGDDIQAMKAGSLEIADLLVVNKADRPGAERMAADLGSMLEIRREAGGSTRAWVPPVLLVEARAGRGIEELDAELRRHRDELRASGELVARRRSRLAAHLEGVMVREARRAVRSLVSEVGKDIVERMESGHATPYSIAAELLRHMRFP
jgi:LAO/AO transport system kinase